MSVRVLLLGRGLFRETLRALLRTTNEVRIVGEGAGWEAIPSTLDFAQVDAIIADGDALPWPAASAVVVPRPHILISLRHNRLVVYRPHLLQPTPQGLAQALGLQEHAL